MLKTLKYVQGAVLRNERIVPALSHFHISEGRILGYNGALAISAPIPLDLKCSPRAAPFVKAVQTCKDETVELHLTANNRLAVRSGSFTAYIDCFEEDYPDVKPEGEDVKVPGSLLEALTRLRPFIALDASRGWARGVLFRGCSAFATNNVIAAEHWLGYKFPIEVNIPEEAVDELLRIGEEPVRIQLGGNSATFHFAGDRWLRTQLLSTEWPQVHSILERDSNCVALPAGFFEALEDLLPFVDELERLFFLEGKLSTSLVENLGASVIVPGIPAGPCFNIKQLINLRELASTVDFSMYPNPCIFYGEKMRGAIVGMRY